MRDEERIDRVLEELDDYWHEHPDLRLSQVIGNVAQSYNYDDPYYMEDEELLAALEGLNKS